MTGIRKLRLGSRASLLASAQSRLIIAALSKQHPDIEFELVTLDTRGDKDLSQPLSDVRDPDFFSAELDRALLDGQFDVCVHSYKDLSRHRPEGIATAAVPARAHPADVILFRDDIETCLADGKTINIGSSSLRRERNTGDFLALALPQHGAAPGLNFVPIRGAVPDRLRRILPAAADRLDAVVVALAGIERLWRDPDGRESIAQAMAQSRLMVLPLSACPTAPGQGALAVECRTDDTATQRILASINCTTTTHLVEVEQQWVADMAEATALKAGELGATAWPHATLGYVARLRGRGAAPNSTAISACRTAVQPDKPAAARPWSPELHSAASIVTMPAALDNALPDSGHVFVAHWHALANLSPGPDLHCWTSGPTSWRALAAAGVWVEGCTDNLGVNSLTDWLDCAVLGLPDRAQWTALTHADAIASWRESGFGQAIATYRHVHDESNDDMSNHSANSPTDNAIAPQGIDSCTHVYWQSPQQFRKFGKLVPAGVHHACGPGKTLKALRDAGIDNPAPFPSYQEWQQWLS